MTHRQRWGDDDRYFGPFTYARNSKHYNPLAIELRSGTYLRLSGFGHTLLVALPAWVLRHYVGWHDLSHADWATPGPDGRKGYTETHERVVGFSYSDGFLQFHFGRQTMDSSTDRSKGYFLPWTQWRHVRHSFYGVNGEHVATLPDTGKSYLADPGRWDRERAIEAATPTVSFEFLDYDAERIVTTTKIEEREWRFGTGWFKWLSLFRKPKIIRSLDIEFSKETGPRKGSWKGGTIGHSIDMEPGELHEAAFRRYCAEHNMTFIGPTPSTQESGT